MAEDETGVSGQGDRMKRLKRTVDRSESKSGEISPKGVAGRYTGLDGHPYNCEHDRGRVRGYGRGIKTAGFSHRCNLPSVIFPIFSLYPEMWP